MKPYASPQHTAVGMSLTRGDTDFTRAGDGIAGIADEALIFEIGSITKVFTAILLYVLVEEGKVDPDAPIQTLSDDLSDVPGWITARQLTSHTSGLPRIHVPIWQALLRPLPKDPYASFSRADLMDWMRSRSAKEPPTKPRYGYSNLGVGLLGEALAIAEGVPFVQLLTTKVLAPLGMTDTTDHLSAEQLCRFVHPKNTKGQLVPPWTFQSMAAAGCLRSSARDLARFSARVIQAMNAPETTLDRAICATAAPIFGLGPRRATEPVAQCAGWISMSLTNESARILHHDGGTAGATSGLYICPENSMALAVLSNNGVAVNLMASLKLEWSNQRKQAQQYFDSY